MCAVQVLQRGLQRFRRVGSSLPAARQQLIVGRALGVELLRLRALAVEQLGAVGVLRIRGNFTAERLVLLWSEPGITQAGRRRC